MYRLEGSGVRLRRVRGISAALLLRPYISGLVWNMSPECLQLMAEGISLYKEIRQDIRDFVPFFPLGFANQGKEPVLAYGVRGTERAYLAVLTPRCDYAEIPLPFAKKISGISVIYPKSEDCNYELKNGVLCVWMPQAAAGRLFRIDITDAEERL